MKHTILGAGGSIGNALAYELIKSGENVRLVSRSEFYILGTEAFKADLADLRETLTAVSGSDIVYLCAGLKYDSSVWAEFWPKIMQNSIDACKSTGAKLVFFDNVYMYGKVKGIMTESTPCNPCSRKGEIRARIALNLENEISKKNINALIARSADLYGPWASKNSVPYILVIDRLLYGKKARWLCDLNRLHSFTYTLDAAKAMVLLSEETDCFNQTWHLPTFSPALNGQTFIELAAKEIGVNSDYKVLRKWMIKIAGHLSHTAAESVEMLYQSEFDYQFDSTKFNKYFDYKPIAYSDGIHDTILFIMKNLNRMTGTVVHSENLYL